MNKEKLKDVIRKEVKSALNEISQTGNVAGYQTPFAFTGKSDEAKEDKKDWMKKINKQYGYTLVNESTPEALQDFYAYFRNINSGEWDGSRNDNTGDKQPPVTDSVNEAEETLRKLRIASGMLDKAKKVLRKNNVSFHGSGKTKQGPVITFKGLHAQDDAFKVLIRQNLIRSKR